MAKFGKKPDKEEVDDMTKIIDSWKKKGVKVLSWYWTLGRYDAVVMFEAPSEKEAMKMSIEVSEWASLETLVAVPRAEAIKLL
jgi:uncharacterized protein with GYD domain